MSQNTVTAGFSGKPGNYRWTMVALLFAATTINYIDRNTLSFIMLDDAFKADMLGIPEGSVITPALQKDFLGIMGKVDAVFKGAYALGFLVMGTLIDRVGVRLGYSISILVWALSAISHAFVRTAGQLQAARLFLGIGESGNFPSAVKTVAEWFPRKERSLAAGIFNAGSNIGIITVAFSVPYLLLHYGWRTTFIVTASLGFILLICWRLFYRQPQHHKGLTKQEFDYIKSDAEDETGEKMGWAQILPYRQTWAIGAGKLLTDMVWYFYIFLLPTFFAETKSFKLDLKHIGWPFLVIYLVSDAGSVGFGWLSSYLLRKGWSLNAARKTTMLVCALCVVPVVSVAYTDSLYVAVALVSLAAAAHQGWSAHMYTLATDMFPKRAIGSVIGFAGMLGACGSMLLSYNYKVLLNTPLGFGALFIIASGAYLTALLIIQLLVPVLRRVEEKTV